MEEKEEKEQKEDPEEVTSGHLWMRWRVRECLGQGDRVCRVWRQRQGFRRRVDTYVHMYGKGETGRRGEWHYLTTPEDLDPVLPYSMYLPICTSQNYNKLFIRTAMV